jgi:hypothetical protein
MEEVSVVLSEEEGANKLSSSSAQNRPPSPNSHTESEKGSVVDVEKAIEQFAQLQQSVDSIVQEELRKSQGIKKSQDIRISKDVEMAVDPASSSAPTPAGEFDIRIFFEDSVRRARAAGHSPKRMGVVVNGLTVVGMGADAATIPDNLDIIKALNPLNW